MYCRALAFAESGKYDEALKILKFLGNFKDSAYLITYYSICKQAFSAEATILDILDAAEKFDDISIFRDSAKKAEECRQRAYNMALDCYNEGNYDGAYEMLEALSGYENIDTIIENDKNISDAAKYRIGNIVEFGIYEQDNISSNGKEAIEWQILAREGGRVLLISKYALDCQKYISNYTDITWEKCTLRTWLNETFLNTAFSAEEQKQIVSSKVTADKNPNYGTNPGNDTTDKVFLLSVNEVNQYFTSDSAMQCKPTAYAKAQGCNVNKNNKNCWWWLRTPGRDAKTAVRVSADGSVNLNGYLILHDATAVRPAIWINLDS